jgi:hypothetical protein
MGNGRQAVSWIHIDDAVAALLWAIDEQKLAGPVNLTAPNATSNGEMAAELGRALHRPSWLPVPSWALQLALKDGAEPLLVGRRAAPAALNRAGFAWRYPDIRQAIEAVLRAENKS